MKKDSLNSVARSQWKNWKIVCLILIGSAGVALHAAHNFAYLALVGPCPMRFAAVIPPSTNRFVLPVPVPPPVVAPETGPKPAVALPGIPAPVSAAPPVENSATAPTIGSTTPEAVVSPQMLLRYFNKSTNGNTSVTAPVEFTPPPAAAPNQSSATYSTTP